MCCQGNPDIVLMELTERAGMDWKVHATEGHGLEKPCYCRTRLRKAVLRIALDFSPSGSMLLSCRSFRGTGRLPDKYLPGNGGVELE